MTLPGTFKPAATNMAGRAIPSSAEGNQPPGGNGNPADRIDSLASVAVGTETSLPPTEFIADRLRDAVIGNSGQAEHATPTGNSFRDFVSRIDAKVGAEGITFACKARRASEVQNRVATAMLVTRGYLETYHPEAFSKMTPVKFIGFLTDEAWYTGGLYNTITTVVDGFLKRTENNTETIRAMLLNNGATAKNTERTQTGDINPENVSQSYGTVLARLHRLPDVVERSGVLVLDENAKNTITELQADIATAAEQESLFNTTPRDAFTNLLGFLERAIKIEKSLLDQLNARAGAILDSKKEI
ncbi:hypothetical protein CSA80_03345 [Candidatus Saccharibacteria bacterium]|nr:MAG: hypothetical protein CSA80_03345 [Candidatus Saccharibacteria bacterium]